MSDWVENAYLLAVRDKALADPDLKSAARPYWTRIIGAYQNESFGVTLLDLPTEWGAMLQISICAKNVREPSWPEKMRIKDHFAGATRTAIEVYPARRNIVDMAPCWHLWVLPEGFALPFTLEDM